MASTSTIIGDYKSRRRVPGKIIIPSTGQTKVKIIITDDDGTNHTVLDSHTGTNSINHVISGSYAPSSTDRLGTFQFTLVNDKGRFLDKFDGGEVVRIYSDETDATTLRFYGKIDDDGVKYGLNLTHGFYVNIDGRDYPELVDETVTGIQDNADGDVAIASILNEFYSDVKLEFWNGSAWAIATYDSDAGTVSWSPSVSNFPTPKISMSYQHRKGMTVFTEILKKLGMDSYLRYDEGTTQWYLRTFVSKDITSSLAISYGINMTSLGEYGKDEVFNRIIAYGKGDGNNVILLKTEEDATSQSNLWVKEKIINVPETDTMTEIEDKTEYELSEGISRTSLGRFGAVNLSSLNTGEMLECVVPYCGINGLHKAYRVTHSLSMPFSTVIEINKKIKKVENFFAGKDNPDDIQVGLPNSNNMKDSYTAYFIEGEDKIIHDNTEEIDGVLKLQTGQTTGTATSVEKEIDYTVTECELRRYDNSLVDNDKYYVSADGETWERYTATIGKMHTFANPGTRIKFRIVMLRTLATDSSPVYNSVSLLVK